MTDWRAKHGLTPKPRQNCPCCRVESSVGRRCASCRLANRTQTVPAPTAKPRPFRRINPAIHAELMAQHRRAEARYRKRQRYALAKMEKANPGLRKLIAELKLGVDIGRTTTNW